MKLDPADKRLTLRNLLRHAVENPETDLDVPVYIVAEDKIRDEYPGDEPDPEVTYEPNSWLELRHIQTDSESTFESVLLLVCQPQADAAGLYDDDTRDSA